MKNFFKKLLVWFLQLIVRKFKKASKICDPYITGYFFIKPVDMESDIRFFNIETPIYGEGREPNKGTEIKRMDAEAVLAQACMSVGVDYERHTIRIRFLESTGLPIFQFLKKCIDFQKEHPVSTLFNLYHWTTRPDGISVEYCCRFMGLRLASSESEVLGQYSDSSFAVDILETDVDFFYNWHSPYSDERNLDVKKFCSDEAVKAFQPIPLIEEVCDVLKALTDGSHKS